MSLSTSQFTAVQPFQCSICQRRFTRQENLKRHVAIHEQPGSSKPLACPICGTTFSRNDLRCRHMKKKHPHMERRNMFDDLRTPLDAVVSGHGSSTRIHRSSTGESPRGIQSQAQYASDSGEPRDEYGDPMVHDHGWPLSSSRQAPRFGLALMSSDDTRSAQPNPLTAASWSSQEESHYGTAETSAHQLSTSATSSVGRAVNHMHLSQYSSPEESFSDDGSWYPSHNQVLHGVDLYFTHCSNALPFIHRPTFNVDTAAAHLLLAILCLGYQYDDDPDNHQRLGSGAETSMRCYYRALAVVDSIDDEYVSSSEDALVMVQGMLLLEICAISFLCGQHSATGLRLHSRTITLARSAKLLQIAQKQSESGEDLDAVWQKFIAVESCKRTALAIHQIDALWYQVLSIPRLLSHLEIKHDLPCPADDWMASTSAQWAYQQLTCKSATPLPTYQASIRHVISADPNLEQLLPSFDSFGLNNIAHFILSSIREISGWTTITGLVSMNRVEPLKASLLALKPYAHPATVAGGPTSASAAPCESTLEMAMIELHVWSLSHTGGDVHSSIDTVLLHTTSLAAAGDLVFSAEIFEAIRPHVDWFLQYLHLTLMPDSEPPWTTLFAYKVFLITWQCLQQGLPAVMKVVQVSDGDTRAALQWAKEVFQRRERWAIGRIILKCLDILDEIA